MAGVRFRLRAAAILFKLSAKSFMKKRYAILIASAALSAASCSTIISDESYAMATRGETVQTYSGFGCSEAVLRNATLLALQERGWVVTDTNNPIKARLSELRQEARISIQVKSGVLVVDTKGFAWLTATMRTFLCAI